MTAVLPLLAAALLPAAPGPLRAGAYAIDVTPERFPVIVNCYFNERTATTATSKLHARCLVLDDGGERLGVVIVDSCMMPRELIDRAKALVPPSAGLRPERILVAATHTHSAPAVMGCLGSDADPHYPAFLEAQIARGLEKAAANLVPAKLGWTAVAAPGFTHNRRWIFRPDKVRTDPFGNRNVRANMHPGYQHPDAVGPSGPVDDGLSLLSVQTADGKPLAVLANFSQHYFGSQPVSADYCGMFCEKLGRAVGGEAMIALSQGTSGDLMWMDYGKAKSTATLDSYTDGLVAIAAAALQRVEHSDRVPLGMREAKLTLGRRTPDLARLAWADDVLAKLNGQKPRSQPEIYAREARLLHAEPTRELRLQAIRVGDLGIAAIPDEVFALTGLKLKAAVPLKGAFTIELANGAEGYIPPPEQHALGGYTTWPARTAGMEVYAEPRIVETLLGLFEQLAGARRKPITEPTGDYTRMVLDRKPSAYWRLGDATGPTAADAAGKHPATFEPGVALYLDGRPGVSARCVHLAGGRVKATLPDLPASWSASLFVWNGLPADARAVTGRVLTCGDDAESLAIAGKGEAAGRLVVTVGGQRLLGKTPLGFRAWHHVLYVRDGGRVAVYLDGRPTPELVGEAPTAAAGGTLWLGGGPRSTDDTLEGRLDEAAVFPRALAAGDAAALAGPASRTD
jgi:hypothetical protein